MWITDRMAESLARDPRVKIQEDNPADGPKRYYAVINGKWIPIVGLQRAFRRRDERRNSRAYGPNEWRSWHESRKFSTRWKRAWSEARLQRRFQSPVRVFFRMLFP